jgi:hypothetical protein
LTVEPQHYPEYIRIDNNPSLPVRNERLHYAGTFSLFSFLINVRL